MEHLGDLLACAGARWSPKIGDPSAMGWATVAAYLAAALLAALAARGAPGARPRERRFWAMLAVALCALAVNKQFDLQSALTALGRCEAQLGGWYGRRREVQEAFIAAIAVGAVALAAGLAIWLRADMGRVWVGVLGVALLLGFVLIRAAGFHHVDALIGMRVAGFRLNWAFELGAIGVTALGATLALRR